MGGRSRERENGVSDWFGWLRDVSDARLDRYGRAGRLRYLQGAEDPARRTGVFEAVWDNAAREYARRHGEEPEWSPGNTPPRVYQEHASPIEGNMVTMTLSWDGSEYVVKRADGEG